MGIDYLKNWEFLILLVYARYPAILAVLLKIRAWMGHFGILSTLTECIDNI